MPLQITVTSKHRQCDCQHSSQLLCAPGNLFQPWPTPPQPTPSDGGHKAQAPRQPCWLVTSRDPVTIIMTSDWHRIEIFETETKWKKYENMCFGMLWSNCTDQKRTYQAISNGPWTPSCRFSKVKSFTASFHAALFRIPSHSTHVHTSPPPPHPEAPPPMLAALQNVIHARCRGMSKDLQQVVPQIILVPDLQSQHLHTQVLQELIAPSAHRPVQPGKLEVQGVHFQVQVRSIALRQHQAEQWTHLVTLVHQDGWKEFLNGLGALFLEISPLQLWPGDQTGPSILTSNWSQAFQELYGFWWLQVSLDEGTCQACTRDGMHLRHTLQGLAGDAGQR